MTAPAIEQLVPAARALARRQGALPSARSLMHELRVGQPKARKIRHRLVDEVLRTTSRRGRVQADRTASDRTGRRQVRRAVPVSGVPVSPGMPALDPWMYAQPTEYPDPPRLSMNAPGATGAAKPLPSQVRTVPGWPILLLALPAFVAIWSGWVGLGSMTGFGVVHPLPGIADGVSLNTAITLPIGLETYATYALWVWLSRRGAAQARRFARASALGSLILGAAGQVAYHQMAASGMTAAPWWITTIVACLPVAVVGMGAALYHLVHSHAGQDQ